MVTKGTVRCGNEMFICDFIILLSTHQSSKHHNHQKNTIAVRTSVLIIQGYQYNCTGTGTVPYGTVQYYRVPNCTKRYRNLPLSTSLVLISTSKIIQRDRCTYVEGFYDQTF